PRLADGARPHCHVGRPRGGGQRSSLGIQCEVPVENRIAMIHTEPVESVAKSGTDVSGRPPPPVASRTRAEMVEAGRALRSRVPRRSHGGWRPAPDRVDPLDILDGSNATRLPDLVPVRNGRMTASPFAFYRGAPAIMAADLSRTPRTGIPLQI